MDDIMKAGVLIIGSLFWDTRPHRIEWREQYLDMDSTVKVAVPICYGRCSQSRGNTYTMTFRHDENMGKSGFVPFLSPIKTVDDLIGKSSALWDAEQAERNTTNTIGSSWGIVGALFKKASHLSRKWTSYFQSQVKEKRINVGSMSYIDEKGFLRIPWPQSIKKLAPLDTDIIFATVTKPEKTLPDPTKIAKAWISQNGGYEEYYFKNIISDIRTYEDLDIWEIIKNRQPEWIKKSEYAEAINILDVHKK